MKKQKQRLSLNKETIKTLDPVALGEVAGGGYTCGGTMCGSCSYVSAVRKCIIQEK